MLRIFKKKIKYTPKIGDTIYGRIILEDKFGFFNDIGELEKIFVQTIDDFGVINIKSYDKERVMYTRFLNDKSKKVLSAKMLLVENKQKWEI